MKTLTVRFAIIIIALCGFGYANVAFAANDKNPDDAIIGVSVGPDGMLSGSITLSPATYTDLESADVGTLPTSPFYFLKQWGRGITRMFTFGWLAKTQLELDITNQIAAELLAVNNANPDDAKALKKALENFTNAQERLNFRIAAINNGNTNVTDSEKLLRDIDGKTAKHAALLGQVSARWNTDPYPEDSARKSGIGDPDFDVLAGQLEDAHDNILKTFTITVTPVNDAPSLKQRAEEQIRLAGVAIDEAGDALMAVSTTRGKVNEEAHSALGQVSTTRGMATVPKQTQGATFGEKARLGDSDDTNELDIFDRWGKSIAKAMENLSEANKAFAEGKYGEAYGLARSVEAQVAHIYVAAGDVDGDGTADTTAPNPSPAEPAKRFKTSEDISPLPQDRATAEDSAELPEVENERSSQSESTGAESPTVKDR